MTAPDSPDVATVSTGERRLLRVIDRGALTAIVINSVVGSGVFGLPAPLAGLVGPWSPAAVLAAGWQGEPPNRQRSSALRAGLGSEKRAFR